MDVDPEALVMRVQRFTESRQLLPAGGVVVAISGGQDSVCMLDVLRRLQADLGLRLHVAHLNHMFRGAQAEEEAEHVRSLAAGWGLPATVAAIDVPSYRARHRLGKQVAARYARYQFLAGVAEQVGAERVAVGHTADDAVETLLMNLLRGSGLAGLRGIVPVREMAPGQLGPPLEAGHWRTEQLPAARRLPVVARPILELFRAETEAYCVARGLSFRRDPSNLDTAYRRTWVRTRLLPTLERHVPGVRERLRNAADLLADEHALVSRATEDAWSALARESPGGVEFDLEGWARLEMALRRQLLRRAVERLAGSLENLSRTHVDAAELVARRGPVGARIDLPGGLVVERGYASFWLAGPSTPPAGEPAPREPLPLAVPGVVAVAGAVLEAALLEVPPGEPPLALCSVDRWRACLDAEKVGPVVLVRRRRPADRFVPLGMDRPKKLQDFLVDEKVPRGERDRVPIVATPEAIVWVAGHRIDDRFKVTPETRRIVMLTLVRIENSE